MFALYRTWAINFSSNTLVLTLSNIQHKVYGKQPKGSKIASVQKNLSGRGFEPAISQTLTDKRTNHQATDATKFRL